MIAGKNFTAADVTSRPHVSARRNMRSGLGPSGLLMMLVSQSALAGDYQLSEADWAAEIPDVLYATRQQQSIVNAPSSVTIINRDMIRAQGATNVAEILRLVPGFQAFASNGSTFGVTPHGFTDRDPRRTEVRVNGRSVYQPLLSSVSWESLGITPDDIAYIEVIRGSNVPAYGSNATLGAVNIVTRSPVLDAGGRSSVTMGSAATRVISARQNFASDATSMQVRAGYKESEGFKGVRDEAYVGHLVFNSVYTPNLKNTLELELGHSDGQFGIGDGDHLDEFTDEDRRASWLHASWQGGEGKSIYKLRASYSNYEFVQSMKRLLSSYYEVPVETIPLLFPGHEDELIDVSEGDRLFSVANIEFENHLKSDTGWQGVWGVGIRRDQLDSERYLDGANVNISTFYLFGNAEWQATRQLVLNAGFMLEEQEGFGSDLSPRVALNYSFNDNHHARISATRAYRQPALLETQRLRTTRFSDGTLVDLFEMSDADIQSERVESYELAYLYYSSDRKISIDVKLFREDVEEGIITGFDAYLGPCIDPPAEVVSLAERYCPTFYVGDEFGALVDDRVRILSNTAHWFAEGIELQASWYLSEATWLRLDGAFLEYGGERDRRLSRPSYIVPLTDYLPEKSGGLLLGHKWGSGWHLGSYLQYVDTVKWRNGTLVERHTRWDLNVGKTLRRGKSELDVTLKIQNLAKDTYLEFQRNNEFGRRALLSVTFKWP